MATQLRTGQQTGYRTYSRSKARLWLDRTRNRITRTVPAFRNHLRDHAYSWLAMGFIDAAAFVHSLFTGLLVTGILLFLFEMKIGD